MHVFNFQENRYKKISGLSSVQKLLCILLLTPGMFIDKSLNNDIWFILNSGRYVMNYGIPYTEPFTIHGGLSFVMQQWLTSVIFWINYENFGEVGLKIIVYIVYILLVYISFKFCMFLSENNFFVSFALTFLSGILLTPYMTERPFIFMFLIILLEIYFLESYIKSNKFIFLIMLPILSILLVNLEAAMWPILFVILIPYYIDSFRFKFKFIEGQGFGKRSVIVATLGMFAAGFINPYGFSAMSYLCRSYGISEISTWISEMQCADINSLFGKIMFFTFFIVISSFILYKEGNHRLRFYLLALGTGYMALSSIRSFPIFVICGLLPMSFYLRNIIIDNKSDNKTMKIRKILTLNLAVILIAATFVISSKEPESTIQQDVVKSVDYLDKLENKNIKLYTGYNDGGYLEFRGFKVYIDPRADVFLKSNNGKADIFLEYYKLERGQVYYKEILEKYDFDYILVSKEKILYKYLDHDTDYQLVHSSDRYKIFKHIN